MPISDTENIQIPKKIPYRRVLYSGLGCTVKTLELACNSEIGGHSNKTDKTYQKNKRVTVWGKGCRN